MADFFCRQVDNLHYLKHNIAYMKKQLKIIWNRIWRDIRTEYQVVIILGVLYLVMHKLFSAFCPSILITGFPCPGCGLTRAVLCLATGQFARSFRLNPSAGLWILFAVYVFIRRYIQGKEVRGKSLIVCGIAVFMLVIYIYRMYTIFPNRPPYVYTSDNYLARLIPWYSEIVKKIIY